MIDLRCGEVSWFLEKKVGFEIRINNFPHD